MLELNKIYNMDCLELMKTLPDKYFDLALIDPPYGINIDIWDKSIPSIDVFNEIFRISKNQLIFGGNYFNLKHTESWICWDKTFKFNRNLDMSEFELIWSSFKHKSFFIRYTSCGNFKGFENPKVNYDFKGNLHPTQKPEEVIRLLINKFTKEGDIVLDCFMGSGTTAVVCKQLNRNFIGCDISKEYCDIANKRLQQENLLSIFKNNKGV